MPNYGLLTGIADGIKQGMISYQTAKQIQRQNQMQDLLGGVMENPQTGILEFTPEMKAQKEFARKKQALEMQEYDPGSGAKVVGGLLGEGIVPEDMSTHQAKEFMPLLTAKMKSKETNPLDDQYKLAKINRLNAGGGFGFKDVGNLRKEYNALPQVKTFSEVQTSYENMQKAARSKSPYGDMAMIYAIMKMYDPNTGVKEGEYASAKNAASLPDQLVNAYNKARLGTLLNRDQRKDLLNQGEHIFSTHQARLNEAKSRYSDIIDLYGIDPNLIFGRQQGLLQTPQPSMPQAEETKVYNGVTYKKVGDQWLAQ
jgi:hypothetical protein